MTLLEGDLVLQMRRKRDKEYRAWKEQVIHDTYYANRLSFELPCSGMRSSPLLNVCYRGTNG